MPDSQRDTAYSPEERLVRVELRTSDNTHELEALRTSLDSYVLKLSARPSWAVVYILTFLQACIGVLATACVYLVASR